MRIKHREIIIRLSEFPSRRRGIYRAFRVSRDRLGCRRNSTLIAKQKVVGGGKEGGGKEGGRKQGSKAAAKAGKGKIPFDSERPRKRRKLRKKKEKVEEDETPR